MTRVLVAGLLVGAMVSGSPEAQNADEPLWNRYPAISPDGSQIAFTYKGDLYLVPSAGGTARPLTSHEAHDYMPVWSPDGSQIAFASDRYGNFDVFIISVRGGEPRRLTYHSAAESPFSFTPDGRSVVFGAPRLDTAEHRGFPAAYMPELYLVPATGGRVTQMLTTPAEDVQFSSDGRFIIYHDKKGQENPWRKHHVSSVTRDIWVYDTQAATHRKVTTFAGEDRTPVLTDNDRAFYYLSEASGSFNVHRMPVAGGASQQVTNFKARPVRFLTAARNGMLSFSYDGALYTMTPGQQPKKVAITIATDAKATNERIVSVTNGAGDLAVAPSGKEVAFIARGDVFVTSVEGGVTKQVSKTPELERSVGFSPDGKALVYSSERGGRWQIIEARRTRDDELHFYAATVLRETPLVANEHENYQPEYSPDGKSLAYIEDRMMLKVLNLETKQAKTLLTDQHLFSMGDHDQYFQWSPDSQWLLFDYAVPGTAPGEVGLVRADGTGSVINLTQSGFNDRGARWILDGKAMLWFSNRDGLKSVAQSGNAQADAYGMFFAQDAWDRFRLSKEDFALLKEADEADAKAKTPVAPMPPLDVDAARDRKARLTIHSSSLGDALVSKDGESLYYLARFERGLNLWTTTIRTRETKQLVALNANSGSLQWDKDQKSLFLLADGAISKIDPATGKRDNVSISGEKIQDQAAERRAQFESVWRRTKQTFYTKTMHGVDWDEVKPDYLKYLAHIATNYEMSELLAEMLGELNVSHSGSSYAATGTNLDATASLGVFFDETYRGAGVRVAEVIKGGPLDKAGMNIAAGSIIQAIDGEAIPADRDLAQYLNRRAGKRMLLTVASPSGATRDIVVMPITLGEQNGLLYTRWVKRNEAEVDRLSNGTLGYVHIPGMNDGAYRTTLEEVFGKFSSRKALVVDTRNNGGGDLVADLEMFLSGKYFFDYTTDGRSTGFEPNFRWTKPSIALANEANYSDGHCFAWTYQTMKVGQLVGMPVPGTCTFAGWATLPDTGIRWGVPPLGVKDSQKKFLENWQTEPDIKVANSAEQVVKGRDEQLEAAVAALMKVVR
jgi:Tol biopolymer transport system component/C-terminal processing protease CtpA/Prc